MELTRGRGKDPRRRRCPKGEGDRRMSYHTYSSISSSSIRPLQTHRDGERRIRSSAPSGPSLHRCFSLGFDMLCTPATRACLARDEVLGACLFWCEQAGTVDISRFFKRTGFRTFRSQTTCLCLCHVQGVAHELLWCWRMGGYFSYHNHITTYLEAAGSIKFRGDRYIPNSHVDDNFWY